MHRPPLQSVTLNGVTACFTRSGHGPPVAFVVSPYSRIDVYWPAIAALSHHYEVTAIEPPGCGCGSVLNPAWDFHQYANWLADFLIAQIPQPATLIGHSNSAAIAAICAARHPGGLTRLVLVDPVGADGPHAYVDFLPGATVCAAFELRFALRLIPRGLQNLRRHPNTVLKQLQQSAATDLRPIAPRIRTRTLVAWGAMDCVMPIAGLRKIHELLPNCQTYVHPHGNHDWLIEYPTALATAVRAFA